MTHIPTSEVPLKLFGIDRVIAVMNESRIPQQQLNVWSQEQLKSAVFQSDKIIEHPHIRELLLGELNDPLVPLDRTLFISDVPKVLSASERKNLAMVVGLGTKSNMRKRLYEQGADLVLDSIDDLSIIQRNSEKTIFIQSLPGVFNVLPQLNVKLDQGKPLFFFDYDGTLAPIQSDPAKAFMSDSMRKLLEQLAFKFRVAVVSGRDMDNLKQFIKLDSLIYAGSHGFRISGPEGIEMQHEETHSLLPQLEHLSELLENNRELSTVGIEIERKHMAITVHYRNAPKGSHRTVSRVVREIIRPYKDFKAGRGKKIIEIRPAVPWHKGRAVDWILKKFEEIDQANYVPIYLGDDLTDEDAFKAIADTGLGVIVGEHDHPSAAHCRLDNVQEVQKLLHHLLASV